MGWLIRGNSFDPTHDNKHKSSFVRPYEEKQDISDILGIILMFSLSLAGLVTVAYFNNKSKSEENQIEQKKSESSQYLQAKDAAIVWYNNEARQK